MSSEGLGCATEDLTWGGLGECRRDTRDPEDLKELRSLGFRKPSHPTLPGFVDGLVSEWFDVRNRGEDGKFGGFNLGGLSASSLPVTPA